MANVILYWNDVALEANRVSHTNGKNEQTGPPLSARALAMVHLAMYDAYAGIINNPATHPPYQVGLPVPAVGASVKAAVGSAAHAMLNYLFPSQKAFFDKKLSEAGLSGPGITEGRDFGVSVVQALINARKADPGVGDAGYSPSMAHGRHRPDPDNPTQGFHAPLYGKNATCFASARFALDPPPVASSVDADYMRAYRSVKAKGIASELTGTVSPANTRRKSDELVVGLYWGYDGAVELGTPPRLYNQIVRVVAQDQAQQASLTEAQAEASDVRLFAFINVAMADAGILAWEEKYKYDFWRPVLGIREHDASMGPGSATGEDNILNECDPEWLPLGAPSTNAMNKKAEQNHQYPCQQIKGSTGIPQNFTPPFPAYPSGHATFGAAAFQITRLFYGIPANQRHDNLFNNLTFVSDEMNGVSTDNKGTVRPRHVRKFTNGLWQMIEENGRSRVYLGVHWVFDAFAVDEDDKPLYNLNIGGVPLGLNVAKSIFDANGIAPQKQP